MLNDEVHPQTAISTVMHSLAQETRKFASTLVEYVRSDVFVKAPGEWCVFYHVAQQMVA